MNNTPIKIKLLEITKLEMQLDKITFCHHHLYYFFMDDIMLDFEDLHIESKIFNI
jgi:hypothetical protein